MIEEDDMMMDLKREMPYLNEEERALYSRLEQLTDEEIMRLIRARTAQLGRLPTKYDIPGADYLKKRFGPWPRILERAGVKPVSETKQRRQEASRQKRNKSRKTVKHTSDKSVLNKIQDK